MTWKRVLNRNGLLGGYNGTHGGLLEGDLRRFETDQRDEQHLRHYAQLANVTPAQAQIILDALLDGAP
jgi:hypothetical protein